MLFFTIFLFVNFSSAFDDTDSLDSDPSTSETTDHPSCPIDIGSVL